jgi:sigma-E factor negative regulatory protein RseA
MVMNENISRLMDGEVGPGELEAVCAGLKRSEAMLTWTCYHVIGDALRGSYAPSIGIGWPLAERLAAEPTLLAPPPRRADAGAAAWIWAAAATLAAVTVVGWTALSVVGEPPAVVAKMQEAGQTRLRPSTVVPADYLLAHQEYSPATQIQGVGPYLRAVAAPGGDRP